MSQAADLRKYPGGKPPRLTWTAAQGIGAYSPRRFFLYPQEVISMGRRLTVVDPDEAPAPSPKMKTLTEAVESGDYREILLAQRREIVASLPNEKGPAKAALHRQLSLISKEIESLAIAAAMDGSVVADVPDEAWDGTGY